MKILIILFLSFYTLNVLSQNIEFTEGNFPNKKEELKEAIENLTDGDYYFNEGFYEKALISYLNAEYFNPNNALLNYKIGRSYLQNSIYKQKAIEYLNKAHELDKNVSDDIDLYYAKAYQLNYEFDKSIVKYKEYRKTLSPSEIAKIGAQLDKRIEECHVGRELYNNPVRVHIENLGVHINSKYPDYSPIINADESVMFFTSRRENTTGGMEDLYNSGYYEDIYITYNIEGEWSAPYNPGKPLNTTMHDAIVGISPDGQKLFIYRGKGGGGIYQCNLEGLKWSKPIRLEKPINSKNHEPSASFSYVERTIYFISDRPGGYGGTDIYTSRRMDNGEWSDAVNLGATLNTIYDEDAIFVHPDGKTIYFSSKGHKNMGGYDIFKSVFENGKWSEPKNMGYPINTPEDDVFFSMSADGRHGYYSTVRPDGFGGHDIYKIDFFGPVKPIINNTEDNLIASLAIPVTESVIEPIVDIETHQLTLLKGFVRDEISNKPLKATIELVDNEKNEVLATFESNSSSGKYLVVLPSGKNYGIAVKAEGYLFHSENFDIPAATEYRIIEKEITLKKIEVGKEIALHNIFFDYKKSELRKESINELDRLAKLLVDFPTLKIEISGHTDSLGTPEYNLELSIARAKSVGAYLVKKGISENRLTFVGYGSKKPVATNETEEGRQMNRRSEFKVIAR
ncbi:MAG: OmpA family protein [Saprospiraceae bacterium]|nr:OmpA family protein [Saprospiraceae bacterium]